MCCCALLVRNQPYAAPRLLHCDLISVFLFSCITPQSNYCMLSSSLSLVLTNMISVYCLLPTIMKVMTVHHLRLPLFCLPQTLICLVYVKTSIILLHSVCVFKCVSLCILRTHHGLCHAINCIITCDSSPF